MVAVRPTTPSDVRFHWEHVCRMGQELGRDGDIIFAPVEEPFSVPFEVHEKFYGEKTAKSIFEPGWERIWVIADENGIYGELELVHRPPLKSCLHRAVLMMGIESSHRKLGFGSKLMVEAIAWAKAQPPLEWLELHVFEGNEPAKALYRKFGFVERGTVEDMFRVHGRQVADTTLVLKLR